MIMISSKRKKKLYARDLNSLHICFSSRLTRSWEDKKENTLIDRWLLVLVEKLAELSSAKSQSIFSADLHIAFHQFENICIYVESKRHDWCEFYLIVVHIMEQNNNHYREKNPCSGCRVFKIYWWKVKASPGNCKEFWWNLRMHKKLPVTEQLNIRITEVSQFLPLIYNHFQTYCSSFKPITVISRRNLLTQKDIFILHKLHMTHYECSKAL